MEELKKQFKIFFYLIGMIITIVTTFYFTNHNNLKEHIDLKSNHLKDNIIQVDKKLDEFKIETKENFNKIDKKIDKLTDIIIQQKKPK
ncbi:hypothetical protein CPX_001775 [Candidatus Phytoplasma pruni]|uniref:Uncharacterized protein n=1 Tax=Candidatus Phytoplasma pruni TaxID=479893 RepID=A0A0M1MZD0_9MOLU|nr:hypothetical protein [Candidatus Phytoplasma pruni]KOR75258.1 hypothetical protein CPX_001775 [Candidatus Phytoplasma pruni]